jgi:hypothetical protein
MQREKGSDERRYSLYPSQAKGLIGITVLSKIEKSRMICFITHSTALSLIPDA